MSLSLWSGPPTTQTANKLRPRMGIIVLAAEECGESVCGRALGLREPSFSLRGEGGALGRAVEPGFTHVEPSGPLAELRAPLCRSLFFYGPAHKLQKDTNKGRVSGG